VTQTVEKWTRFRRLRNPRRYQHRGVLFRHSVFSRLGIPGNLDEMLQFQTTDPDLPEDVDFELVPGPGMNHLASYDSRSGPKPLIPRRTRPRTKPLFDRIPEYVATPLVPERIKNLNLKQLHLSDSPGPGESHAALGRRRDDNSERQKTPATEQTTDPVASGPGVAALSRNQAPARRGRVKLAGLISHTEAVSGVEIPVLRPAGHC